LEKHGGVCSENKTVMHRISQSVRRKDATAKPMRKRRFMPAGSNRPRSPRRPSFDKQGTESTLPNYWLLLCANPSVSNPLRLHHQIDHILLKPVPGNQRIATTIANNSAR